MNKLKQMLKDVLRVWPLLVVIIAGIFLFSGVGFMVALNRLSMFAFILLIFHLIRKALFPYINLRRFTDKAGENPISSAIVFAMIIFFIVSLCYITIAHAMTYDQILTQAKPQLPLFKTVVNQYWSEAPNQYYFPGVVEQETCASLRQCWNPNTQLKTSREYGFGLGQITIAYGKKGKVRFNNFQEAKEQYAALSDWQWDDRFNPKYQFTFITLEMHHLFLPMQPYFSDDVNRWAATLVSYNAGPGTVLDRIAVCSVTKGCNKELWFNGLDTVSSPFEKKLLYGKALYLRRNEYPDNIIHVRAPKYQPFWQAIVLNDGTASYSPELAANTSELTPNLPNVPSENLPSVNKNVPTPTITPTTVTPTQQPTTPTPATVAPQTKISPPVTAAQTHETKTPTHATAELTHQTKTPVHASVASKHQTKTLAHTTATTHKTKTTATVAITPKHEAKENKPVSANNYSKKINKEISQTNLEVKGAIQSAEGATIGFTQQIISSAADTTQQMLNAMNNNMHELMSALSTQAVEAWGNARFFFQFLGQLLFAQNTNNNSNSNSNNN